MISSNAIPGLFLAVVLTSAAPYVVAHDAKQGAAEYLVGFHGASIGKVKNGKYEGGDVIRVDEALGFALIRVSEDRPGFEQRASADSDVRYVREDAPDAFRAEALTNDAYAAQQYAWTRVNAQGAWNVTTGSASVIVAVLDTGVDASHPDLAGARLLAGYNFVANSGDVSDACGHGTHVAGIVGATSNNGIGIAGAAQVAILPVKVMDKDPATGSCQGPFSAVASGIRFATDQGARVISMSLGATGVYDQATEDAIQYAHAHGVLLVAAAGNSGAPGVAWPAADAGVVAVGCTDQTDLLCSFSSTGPEVEVAAPGRNIYSTVPGGAYMSMSGTSMSTPAVSGIAALAFSANPTLSGDQVRALLGSTARDLGAAGRDAQFGYGIVDAGALVAAAIGGAAPPAPPANAAPTASFTMTASSLTATVDGSASRDTDGSIASYAWSWGDGASSSGVTSSHTYAAAGSYSVRLTVTDNAGATGTTTMTVTVSAPAPTPKAHVGDITTGSASSKQGTKLSWSVPVLSGTGTAVTGATVSVSIAGPGVSSAPSGTTASNGLASFSLTAKRAGTYTLCVSTIAASGYAYDASANYESCQSIII